MTRPGARSPWHVEFLLLAAIWGSSFLFMRAGAREFGALPTAGLRVSIAAAFLLPWLLQRGLAAQLARHAHHMLLLGLFNSAIPFVCLSFALFSLSTGLASILNASVPLFGALVAWVWLGARPNARTTVGLLIGFTGVLLLAWDKASFRPDSAGHSSAWAVLACLGACLCYAISASYTRRYLAGLPALVTATGSQLGAALWLALPTWWWWPAHSPGAPAWLAVSALGVLCSGIAYILYFRLIEHIGPAGSLSVTFVVPVFAMFYGGVFLQESVTLGMLGCALVIACGTALSANLLPRALGRRSTHAQGS